MPVGYYCLPFFSIYLRIVKKYIFVAIVAFTLGSTHSIAQVGYGKKADREARREEKRQNKEYRKRHKKKEERKDKKEMKKELKEEMKDDSNRKRRIRDSYR